jgi:hypothetical protein
MFLKTSLIISLNSGDLNQNTEDDFFETINKKNPRSLETSGVYKFV